MRKTRAAAAVLATLTGLALGHGDSPPEALKIEPPHWWARHSLNPVRVMVRGRHLTAARVRTDRPGVRIGATRASSTGTYLFVDVLIDPRAPVGLVPLEITTPRARHARRSSCGARCPAPDAFRVFRKTM
jgi:hypothetical protein